MEFQPWPKTPRLFRDVVITEKIDGTNAAIRFEYDDDQLDWTSFGYVEGPEFKWYKVGAQSRKRLITPVDDNHGFAGWVAQNMRTLFDDLGPGNHFGEWFGQGINRSYGLAEKRFALFNTAKWSLAEPSFTTPRLTVVPTLYEGELSDLAIDNAMSKLSAFGSFAAPGFMNPEGVCIFHTQARTVFKYTFDGDGHKG